MEVINNTLEEFENAENYEKEKHKSHKIPLFKKKKQPLLLFWCIFLLLSSFLYISCTREHDYRALQALGE